jgi:hypothetical protein
VGGALVALTVHLDIGLAYGLAWGFAVSALGVLLAFAPVLRLMPAGGAAASRQGAGSDALSVGPVEKPAALPMPTLAHATAQGCGSID